VQHWSKRDIPNDNKAEQAAVALGFDPYVVWEGWADAQFAACSVACEGCDERFIPTRKGHRFCSANCRSRTAMRRRYHEDPQVRARKIAAARRYYEEAGDYVRAYGRRWHQQNRDKTIERLREYREANREKLAAAQRRRYRENREVILARQKVYRDRKRAEKKAQSTQGEDGTVAA